MFKRFRWVFLVMLPAGALAGLLIAAVVTCLTPKIYESEAVIEVKSFANLPVAAPGRTEGEAPDWVLSEIEKMKSRAVLEKVADGLELTNRWNLAKDEVLPVLDQTLLIQSIRGTDLVSIRARHTNKVDARDIAEEVANAYKRCRMDAEKSDRARTLHELNRVVRDQEDKVEERRKVLETIERTKGIIYKGPDSQTQDEMLEVAAPSGDRAEYVDAQSEFEADQELLQTMKLKQIAERISEKLARENVLVHDYPMIADSPISPNVTLNLAIGTALGLVLSPLLALPVMWRLNRRTPVAES